MSIKPNYQKESEVVAVGASKDPIEQQILAAGNLSEAQVEAIRGFQRRKGLTFGEAAIALGLVRRDSLFLALSKRYNYPVLNFGVDEARFSRELVVGYQPFSTAAESFRSVVPRLRQARSRRERMRLRSLVHTRGSGSPTSPQIWRSRSRRWPSQRSLSTPT
jgi:hypothetical protein